VWSRGHAGGSQVAQGPWPAAKLASLPSGSSEGLDWGKWQSLDRASKLLKSALGSVQGQTAGQPAALQEGAPVGGQTILHAGLRHALGSASAESHHQAPMLSAPQQQDMPAQGSMEGARAKPDSLRNGTHPAASTGVLPGGTQPGPVAAPADDLLEAAPSARLPCLSPDGSRCSLAPPRMSACEVAS
jgi:hypothetical protein